MAWGILWRSESQLDGKDEHLIGTWPYGAPIQYQGYNTAVFRTRDDARKFLQEHYGFIKNRPDLRKEPHGWKMPKIVKVDVSVDVG